MVESALLQQTRDHTRENFPVLAATRVLFLVQQLNRLRNSFH